MFRHASRINTLKDQIIPFINHFFSHLIPSFSILSLKIIQRNFERNKRFQVEKSFRVKVQNMKNISILRLHKMWILDAKKKSPLFLNFIVFPLSIVAKAQELIQIAGCTVIFSFGISKGNSFIHSPNID